MPNFDFLSGRWPLLAKNGAYAEKYFYSDTNASILKLRLFAEELINYVLTAYKIDVDKNATQKDKIGLLSGASGINPGVVDLFHIIRINGNKAAHEAFSDMKEAAECLKAAFKLACWFYVKVTGDRDGLPKFVPPAKPVKKEAPYNVIPLEQYKKDLEEIRSSFENQISELKKQLEERSAVQKSAGEEISLPGTLGINEAQTRKHLIDVLLKEAGWKLDDKDSVCKEYPVSGLRTTRTGNGSIDYLLFDGSGRPVAVVEAKKTSRDPEEGRLQAQDYVDAVEKKFKVRPVIFYTNGHETWMWDDRYAPPRQVWGFYTQSELERLFFRHKYGKPFTSVKIDDKIAGRSYQIKAVKAVLEKFHNNGRRALLVMATGTGKTRTVIALTKAMMEANQAKKVLFLADRDELVEQAMLKKNSFKTFMPEVPQVRITASKAENREADLYFATYQTMINYYTAFGAGFFDLVICDESHRSIYNTYRDIIEYFDAYIVGLTATPVDYVSRNTYRLFQCEDGDPDFYYSFDEACDHVPPYLLRPRKIDVTTDFLRRGIKWANLDEAQRRQLEEEGYDEEQIDFDREKLDDFVYNDDTNRFILQNLMENGIKVKDEIGKTIIFARNTEHAWRLEKLFNELYPQYCGKLAAVIHSRVERCKTLLDDFKEKDRPRIAISVDMLDTGIDVPEIVNLVFAKPVYSKVKFLQMIGRGTRLYENLFAPGEHKKEFIIFDHWKNFEFFDMNADGKVPAAVKSTMQLLFEKKIELLKIFDNNKELDKCLC
jgi:type I restriction enzyme R subunit